MKKLVLALTVVLVLSGIFAVAALTQVEIDRDVTATVSSDTEADVAVWFQVNSPDYDGVAYINNGEIVFDLSGALTGAGNHYNAKAQFTIGAQGADNQVCTITNNTDSSIIFNISYTGVADIVDIYDSGGASIDGTTLASGASVDIHFVLNSMVMTANSYTGEDVGAELQIRLAP